MNYLLFFIPLFTAFAGWLSIKLAIWLLFKPYAPFALPGFKIQGLFPAQWENIAGGASKYAAAEFSGFDQLEEKLNDPKNFENIRPLVETHIDDFLRNKLKQQMPMIGMFIGDKTISTLKTIFIKEIEELFPRVMLQFGGTLKQQFDIEGLVMQKMMAISPEKLHGLVYKQLGKKLQIASIFGTTIGLAIGFIQLAIILFFS